MTPTLDSALLCSSRAGTDLGRMSDRFEELNHNSITHVFDEYIGPLHSESIFNINGCIKITRCHQIKKLIHQGLRFGQRGDSYLGQGGAGVPKNVLRNLISVARYLLLIIFFVSAFLLYFSLCCDRGNGT